MTLMAEPWCPDVKITNNGLTRSGTGCFLAVAYPYGNSGRQRVSKVLNFALQYKLD